MCEILCWKWPKPDKVIYIVEAHGHAEGSPEACAGISALVYALAETLKQWDGQEELKIAYITLENGNAGMMFSCGRSGGYTRLADTVHGAYQCISSGLRQIAEAYPEIVTYHTGSGDIEDKKPI